MSIKKIIISGLALTFSAVMAFSMTACGNDGVSAPGMGGSGSNSNGSSANSDGGQQSVATNGLIVGADGNMSYYVNGELQKNGIVGSDVDGYFYADQNGVINKNYCDGVTVNGVNWCVIEGKATKATADDDPLFGACKDIGKCTNTTMDRAQKLRASFDYLKEAYLEGVRHDPPYYEMDWPIMYANDLFIYSKGDCFSYGAAFAYYGKAIGYEESYACNSGGHGWAEIDGLFYDPEWDMHHQEYNHFGVAPTDPNDVDYSGGISPGEPYMHVKV